ncbi:MAG: hypothetical protein ACSW8G_03400 [Bacillota bacterium]
MNDFEKTEKLVEKTGVSYTDAKRALEEADGDILDALIILEKEGKVQSPKSSTYSTKYEEQTQYVSVPKQVEKQRMEDEERASAKVKRGIHKIWHFLKANNISVKRRNGDLIADMPLWAAVLLLILGWSVVLVLVVISLFFGVRYTFSGETDLGLANKAMDAASVAADKVKEEYHKL